MLGWVEIGADTYAMPIGTGVLVKVEYQSMDRWVLSTVYIPHTKLVTYRRKDGNGQPTDVIEGRIESTEP